MDVGYTESGEHWRRVRGVGAGLKLDLACVARHNGSGDGLYNNDAVRPHTDDVVRAQARLDVVEACAKRVAVLRVPCSVRRALTPCLEHADN